MLTPTRDAGSGGVARRVLRAARTSDGVRPSFQTLSVVADLQPARHLHLPGWISAFLCDCPSTAQKDTP